MSSIIRINPDLPLCWEDFDTVRIGFERGLARVQRPTSGMQRLIGMLCNGISSDRIPQEARRAGATPQETSRVLSELDPVLLEEPHRTKVRPRAPQPAHRLRAMVLDNGREVSGLYRALGSSELYALDRSTTAQMSELVFLVERYLEPLEPAQCLLGSGTPHVLIRFTDRAVHIGPLVAEGRGPCHSCISLQIVASDPVMPVLAAQLVGKRPQSESLAVVEMIAGYAALFVRQWITGAVSAHRTRAVIPVSRGQIAGDPRTETVVPHPGCGCQGLGLRQ